jgi:phytoene dehydrogenase-like protein
MSTAPYDTIIIGAGMSGLAAGIRLAQFDQRVLILERHYLWGGLNSFYKRGGRRFDVGLHALTNWVPKGTRGTPLAKLLRQLRLRHDDLQLGQQSYSEVRFPSARLSFSNDFELLRSEVARAFPHQVDAFEALVQRVDAYDAFRPTDTTLGARVVLAEVLTDPLLIELLLCPVLYYGSAREDDVDWYQFVILFKSLYQEGFARPEGGIKPLLDLLIGRYRELGGELRTRTGVAELVHEGGRCLGVRLDDGEELSATRVLSSAGWPETMRMAGAEAYEQHVDPNELGTLSFVESILVLDREPAALGFDSTIVFFNEADRFDYHRPEGLIDSRSGVICCPNNYASKTPLPEGLVRTTSLANPARWRALEGEDYASAKQAVTEEALGPVTRHLGFDPRHHEVFRDTFTPRTVERFTGKLDGAVYGCSTKRLDGCTPLENLHLIGTDQGLLGVTGAMLSGISIANRYALQAASN